MIPKMEEVDSISLMVTSSKLTLLMIKLMATAFYINPTIPSLRDIGEKTNSLESLIDYYEHKTQ